MGYPNMRRRVGTNSCDTRAGSVGTWLRILKRRYGEPGPVERTEAAIAWKTNVDCLLAKSAFWMLCIDG